MWLHVESEWDVDWNWVSFKHHKSKVHISKTVKGTHALKLDCFPWQPPNQTNSQFKVHVLFFKTLGPAKEKHDFQHAKPLHPIQTDSDRAHLTSSHQGWWHCPWQFP
jgi:hypothetical protein